MTKRCSHSVTYSMIATGRLISRRVISIAEKVSGKGGEVVLASGEVIPHTWLVLVTGLKWPAFIQLSDTEDAE